MLSSRTFLGLTNARAFGVLAAALVLSLLAMLIPSTAPGAQAAERPDGALSISKSVDDAQTANLIPGDEFVYTIILGCDDYDCADVVLTDALPAALAGFEIEATNVSPGRLPATVSWDGCEGTATEQCELTVTPTQDLGDGDVGIIAGTEYRIDITLKVPDTLEPGWEFNGQAITNTASATSTNAADVSDTADVTVTVPVTVDVATTKSWQPASQGYAPGSESTITLGVQNVSNVNAQSLVIQEPADAADGAAELAADNPFRLVDLSGLANTELPQGATSVQVDVYVFDAATGTWSWQAGEPGTTAELPAGVDPQNIGGVRLSFTGDITPEAAGTVALTVEQRATDRISGDSLVDGAELVNTVTGTVTAPNQEPVSSTDDAPYEIVPLDVNASVTKSFDPSEVPAGGSATATITATNDSTVAVDRLVVGDRDFFDDEWVFDGFDAAPEFPEGADTTASLTWYLADGSSVTVDVASGEIPTPPAGVVTGFEFVFTGTIAAGASATITPTVAVATTVVDEDNRTTSKTNTATVEVENEAGTATDSDDAVLNVKYPEIGITIDKTIRPGGAVQPGGSVVVELESTLATGSGFVDPTEIVIVDRWGDDQENSFWNAFRPTQIAPTQIPANTTLTITYELADGSIVEGPVAGAQVEAWLFSTEIDPAIRDQIVGITYTFTNVDGFPKGTTVTPNTEFEALSELRDESGNTSVPNEDPSVYVNEATAQGSGEVPGLGEIISDIVDDSEQAQVQSFACDDGEECRLGSSKRWVQPSDGTTDLNYLSSLSEAPATTRLGWTVLSGYDQVVVSDPAGQENSPEDTVFQAFDLNAVDPISFEDDPYLRWDVVSTVELYNADAGEWQAVTVPGSGWMSSTGFVGYELSAEQSAQTTGVRLTFEPNDDAREASSAAGTPAVGSGVAASTASPMRPILLSWDLRNTVRVEQAGQSPWVIAQRLFNDTAEGSIWNTVRVSGYVDGELAGSHASRDNIALIDLPPAVGLTKAVEPATLTVPNNDDVDPADYPTASYTLRAWNSGAGQDPSGASLPSSNASYLRVTDPAPCGDNLADCVSGSATPLDSNVFDGAQYNAQTNPFEWQNVTGLEFDVLGDQISRDDSVVTFWLFDGSIVQHSITEVENGALTAAQLAQVVGIDVVYQGVDPETTGGTIKAGQANAAVLTVQTQLRTHTRDGGELLSGGVTVTNTAFAELSNVIIADGGAIPFTGEDAELTLLTAQLAIGATKSFSVEQITEANKATPFDVTIGALSQDGSVTETVSSERVTVTDDDAGFWNLVELEQGSTLTATVPEGADRVRIDARVDGQWVQGDWTTGTGELTDLALPSGVTAETVTGLRAQFSRADGEHFSNEAPPVAWSADVTFTVVLRESTREGEPIPWGAEGDAQLSDTVDTLSERPGDGGFYAPADNNAGTNLDLIVGERGLQVLKSQPGTSHVGDVGDSAPWTLEFYNDGEVPLTVDTVVDRLPEHLDWDGIAPVYATSADGTLSTEVELTYDAESKQLRFTWPEGGRSLAAGELFEITVGLILKPGLPLDEWTTNEFVVDTAEALDRCTNGNGSGGNAEGTIDGLNDNQCGTTNYQQPRPGGSLAAFKYVNGDIKDEYTSGEQNTQVADGACVVDEQGYTRYPCASNTAVGATDDWKLQAVNSGTVPYSSITIVDPLPHPGDRMLAGGAERGSEFQPVVDPTFIPTVTGADGAGITVQLTTSADVCVGAGSGSQWRDDPRCDDTAEWVEFADFVGNPLDVTALRATIDFTTTAEGQLNAGDVVELHHRTINVPATALNPEGAPVETPVEDGTVAWNQFGVVAVGTTDQEYVKAPTRAGVILSSGSLEVLKNIVGPGAAIAPDSVQVEVSCTVASGLGGQRVPLSLPGGGVITLTKADDFRAGIEGLPLGAECVVEESGELGSYGETERSDAQTVTISEPGPLADAVQVTITNDYRFGAFEIVKERVGAGAAQFGDGPFTASYSCSVLGSVVEHGTVLLYAEVDYVSTITGVPIGAACTVEEVDAGLAVATTYSPADGTVIVTDDLESPVTVTITNRYEVGQLTVDKETTTPEVVVGEDAEYTITVRNTGQIDATDVEVFDLLPDGSEFVSASDGGALQKDRVRWVISSLPVGAEETLTVTIRFTDAGTKFNQAIVTTPDGPWQPTVPTDPDGSGVESVGVEVAPAVPGTLPSTGAVISGAVIAAAVLLILGGIVMVVLRRRRGADEDTDETDGGADGSPRGTV
ncbi:MAG: DUF5979 domain-containing protein [Mycetocola sp.]